MSAEVFLARFVLALVVLTIAGKIGMLIAVITMEIFSKVKDKFF